MSRGPVLLSVQLLIAAAYAGNSGLRVDAVRPDPGAHCMRLTLQGDSQIARDVVRLARERSRPARLSLVVGRGGSASGDVYDLRDASVASLERVGGALVAVLEFRGLQVTSPLAADPGPPLGAPTIDRHGPNRGWILGLADRNGGAPTEVQVLDVVPPNGDGRIGLRLTPGIEPSIVALASAGANRMGALVLVLPDRRLRRYVEYKLWDATLSRQPGDGALEFRAPVIVCMTGHGKGSGE